MKSVSQGLKADTLKERYQKIGDTKRATPIEVRTSLVAENCILVQSTTRCCAIPILRNWPPICVMSDGWISSRPQTMTTLENFSQVVTMHCTTKQPSSKTQSEEYHCY